MVVIMGLPEIRKKILVLQREREVIELQLMRTRLSMEAGSIALRYTSCQRGNCKCMRGEKHGPFLYLHQKIAGKMKWRYVGKDSDKATVKKVRAYMQYQDRLATLRKLNKESDALFNEYRELLIAKGSL